MSYKAIFTSSLLGSAFMLCSGAEEVQMKAEKAVVITFPSQTQRTYRLMAAQSAAGEWNTLKDGIVGTGGEVTVFYKSESDQKLFFKVETSDGPPGQRSLLSLANLDISNKDLSGYDLEGDDLRGFNFFKSKFDNADLSAANISEANFSETSLIGTDLSHAVVEGVNFQFANFNGANLEGISFVGCYAGWADFRNANLKGVRFDGTVLREANFSGQALTNVSFRASGSKWKGDKTQGLYMANFSGANLTGADLSRNFAAGINLNGATLTGVNFEGSLIYDVNLTGRDLRTVFLRGTVAGADWSGVDARSAEMLLAVVSPGWNPRGATFEAANLEGLYAHFGGSLPLTNVNFRNAKLMGASLQVGVFRNCDFTGADLSFADVRGADFTGCIGLDLEQPGMQYGGFPPGGPGAPPAPTATILPDGTPRVGTNPGVGLAPATAPATLQLVTNDGGINTTQNIQLNGSTFWEGGIESGTFTYEARGRIAVLRLNWTAPERTTVRKLYFTAATGGELYFSDYNGGSYKIGNFTVPQP